MIVLHTKCHVSNERGEPGRTLSLLYSWLMGTGEIDQVPEHTQGMNSGWRPLRQK